MRTILVAIERRDLETIEALFPEDAEFRSVLAASEGRVFRGRQGIRDYFAWFDDAFEEFGSEVEESSTGARVVLSPLLKFSARGKTSGIALDQRIGIVFTFRGEQVARVDSYFDPADALEAAGLSE